MTQHERAILKQYMTYSARNEWTHEESRQRKFERRFESRDYTDSDAETKGEWASRNEMERIGVRDFVHSHTPAEQVTAKMDIDAVSAILKEREPKLFRVLEAVFAGKTFSDIGLKMADFYRTVAKLETIFSDIEAYIDDPDGFFLPEQQ